MDPRSSLRITTAIAGALLLASCQREPDPWTAQRDTAVCTDRQGQRVADRNCDRQARFAGGGGGGANNAFLWYYLGRSSAVPAYGERAYGGSFSRTAGATYFHAPAATATTRAAYSSSVSRGGFGATSRSSFASIGG